MTQTKAQNMAAEIWKTIICQLLSVTATHSSPTTKKVINTKNQKRQQNMTEILSKKNKKNLKTIICQLLSGTAAHPSPPSKKDQN